MAELMLGSRAAWLLAVLACGCGGSSGDGSGTGGAGPGVILGKGGGGAASNGSAGSSSSSGGNANSAGAAGASGNCPAFTPCGGNLVGDWTIKQGCLNVVYPFVASCPDATLVLSPLTVTGTMSFKADNTTTASAQVSFMETAVFPPSCATEAECQTMCEALSTSPIVTDPKCGYDAATGCTYSLTSTQPSMSSGTYEVQGTNVTFLSSSPDAQPGVDSFCVSGNTLTLSQVSANGSTSTLTLTR